MILGEKHLKNDNQGGGGLRLTKQKLPSFFP